MAHPPPASGARHVPSPRPHARSVATSCQELRRQLGHQLGRSRPRKHRVGTPSAALCVELVDLLRKAGTRRGPFAGGRAAPCAASRRGDVAHAPAPGGITPYAHVPAAHGTALRSLAHPDTPRARVSRRPRVYPPHARTRVGLALLARRSSQLAAARVPRRACRAACHGGGGTAVGVGAGVVALGRGVCSAPRARGGRAAAGSGEELASTPAAPTPMAELCSTVGRLATVCLELGRERWCAGGRLGQAVRAGAALVAQGMARLLRLAAYVGRPA